MTVTIDMFHGGGFLCVQQAGILAVIQLQVHVANTTCSMSIAPYSHLSCLITQNTNKITEGGGHIRYCLQDCICFIHVVDRISDKTVV